MQRKEKDVLANKNDRPRRRETKTNGGACIDRDFNAVEGSEAPGSLAVTLGPPLARETAEHAESPLR